MAEGTVTNARTLELNYEYAQRNVDVLSIWFECKPRKTVELLAENNIPLSPNDEGKFGSYYKYVREVVEAN
ncbi:hypothetical protein SAMN05421858_1460 [Haladaptatus litoreus]|uniref:Uncharacterized protein n=1 Tax=Haladaptatus litoreus TaxID=553468 RepID=A0A1N6Y8Q5_9EURY|nr:hypothetical protein [Haladaptatus litoreus]SIR11015.1 hypothetical protein SAMN05421858_1460 [Haladaptatus litoreus]